MRGPWVRGQSVILDILGTITFECVVEIRRYEIIANVLGCDNDTVVRCKCLFMLNDGGVSLSLSNGCAPTAKVVWFSYAHMYKMRGREQTWPNIQCQRVYRSSLYSFGNFSMYLKTLKVGKKGTLVLTMYWGYLPKVCCCSKQMYLSTPVIYLVFRLRRWGSHEERDCQQAVYRGAGTVCPPAWLWLGLPHIWATVRAARLVFTSCAHHLISLLHLVSQWWDTLHVQSVFPHCWQVSYR